MMKASWRDYYELCKPRVVALMLLTAVVGMVLASPAYFPWENALFGILGIGLMAGSAAAVNHLADRHIDAKMARTHKRPLPTGKLSPNQVALFSTFMGLTGLIILILGTNLLTAFLSFLTLVGYAGVYTLYLKHATPQNIVIGGLSGATPPLLGWTAVTGYIDLHSLLLVLVIFIWTPPHFWALAIYRREDYAKVNIPMLPVTHGVHYTKINILIYTLILFGVSLLPFFTGMSGWFYFICTLILNSIFVGYAIRLYFTDSLKFAFKTFRFSILYLILFFIALLADHFILRL